MLDGLLGRGFAAKCKSLIKLTRSRIDVIRRKRQATQKFLKKDMADLLANGLDINAYGRAEGLLVELTLSSCYDHVDQFCEVLLKQMSTMQKQSGCPEECREAVSSLMFAAARFSDLPELRDLRDRFQERYGNSLDCFIEQEFSNKLAGKPSTLEKKVKLMQDIASEFSIRWDARAFEQRMSGNSSTVQEQPKDHGLLSHATDYSKLTNAKYIPLKGDKLNFPPKQSFEEVDEGQRFRNNMGANGFRRNDLNPQPKLESTGNKWNEFEDVISRKDDHDTQQGRPGLASYKAEEGTSLKQVKSGASSHERRRKDTNGTQQGRLDHSSYKIEEDGSPKPLKSYETGYKDTAGGLKYQNRRERTVLEREHGDGSLHWKQGTLPSSAGTYIKTNVKDAPSANDNNGNEDHVANSLRKARRGDIERSYCKSPLPPPYVKPPYVKPPYVKPNVKPPKDGKYGSKSESVFDGSKIPLAPKSEIPGPFIEKLHLGSSRPDDERKEVGPGRMTSHDDNKQFPYQDDMPGYPVPKPKSSRRKHSKSRSAHDEIDYEDAHTGRSSRSRRKDDPRRGLQILFDDERGQKDEEERIIDKLLMHYSKKPSAYEPGKVRRKSRSRHAHGSGGSPVDNSRPKYDDDPEVVTLPPRSVSLPREQTTAPVEPAKVFARAASFQPERPNLARHVHPNLPDCDDLAARIAALRGS
ncbi:uncharacterized protein LOC104436604 isoform X3 [Eucalyptus grandis]|uniref:uncharacterized protein LOC104436604 isoform X3 n=1 Tax=Eucalyptus grandis TaxID=71139 RepID=UPI00192EC207|nr:uncharacterized protein LOC104436604 isoform X3 [Eucalyptus grandis]